MKPELSASVPAQRGKAPEGKDAPRRAKALRGRSCSLGLFRQPVGAPDREEDCKLGRTDSEGPAAHGSFLYMGRLAAMTYHFSAGGRVKKRRRSRTDAAVAAHPTMALDGRQRQKYNGHT